MHRLIKEYMQIDIFVYVVHIPAGTQRWNNVDPTLIQRQRQDVESTLNICCLKQQRTNVDATSRRWINVGLMLFQRCVSAGIGSKNSLKDCTAMKKCRTSFHHTMSRAQEIVFTGHSRIRVIVVSCLLIEASDTIEYIDLLWTALTRLQGFVG